MKQEKNKQKVLFICTHNSARSQMAEGLLRSLYGEKYEAWSAGTHPSLVHPLAVSVMKEIKIDISGQRSKSVDEFIGKEMDYVVTVCDSAKESCPFFPYGKHFLHQSFSNPSAFQGTEEEKLAFFRKVRDEIREWITRQFAASSAASEKLR